MITILVLLVASLTGRAFGGDAGCSSTSEGGWTGHCATRGCCEYDFHVTDEGLCDQAPREVCCYRNNICGRNDYCFDIYATWISRYAYHGSEAEVDAGFAELKEQNVTRVYFNVWADGNLYAESATARANGVTVHPNHLNWAISAAQKYGLDIYAWFEYGTMAGYGTSPNSQFTQDCDAKDWLLYNWRGGQKVYTTSQGGNYMYVDSTNAAVRQFMADMTADIVANHPGLDGIQYDDHFSAPNGFDTNDAISQSQLFGIMKEFMEDLHSAAKSANPFTHISFSPSPVQFARDNHNVDWARWLTDGVVEEAVPQYYRTTAASFKQTLETDLAIVTDYEGRFLPGIRLSGGSDPVITPKAEVDEMIKISYDHRMVGVSFWFANDIIEGTYQVDFFRRC